MTRRPPKGFAVLERMAPRDRRALLLGAVLIVPAFFYVLGVRPYRAALADMRDRLAAERELLDREVELLASASTLPDAMLSAKARAERYEGGLLQGADRVLAETELSDFLESTAVRNRVLLEELRGGVLARGEDPPPGLSVVRLHLRGESDLEGILTFLDEIERATLFLRIRGLALEPQLTRGASNTQEEPGQAPSPSGVVDFQLIVDGFSRTWEYGS